MQNLYKETMKIIINKQAGSIYEKLDLKPGFNIEETVRALGGVIQEDTSGELEENVAAKISAIENGSNFRIIYAKNNDVDADVLLRLSVAHELGHLFLHMAKYDEENGYVIQGDYKNDPKDISLVEWEAEEFATAFLMPENSFRIQVEKFELINNGDKIQQLAELFKVPYKSVIMRGKSLDIWQ